MRSVVPTVTILKSHDLKTYNEYSSYDKMSLLLRVLTISMTNSGMICCLLPDLHRWRSGNWRSYRRKCEKHYSKRKTDRVPRKQLQQD